MTTFCLLNVQAEESQFKQLDEVCYHRAQYEILEGEDPFVNMDPKQKERIMKELGEGDTVYKGTVSMSWANNSNTGFGSSLPPLGYVETIEEEDRVVLGEEKKVRHVIWRLGDGVSNFKHKEFHFYQHDDIKASSFSIGVSGPDIIIPGTTFEWHILPENSTDVFNGSLTESKTMTSDEGEKYICFCFEANVTSRGRKQRVEYWMSNAIPGGLFGTRMSMTNNMPSGKVTISQATRLKYVRSAAIPNDMILFEKHGVSFVPPVAPWESIATQKPLAVKRSISHDDPSDAPDPDVGEFEPNGEEIARYQLKQGGKIIKYITVEKVSLNPDEKASAWMRKITGKGKYYGTAGNGEHNMADFGVWSHDHWSEAKGWTRSVIKVGMTIGEAYLLCVWEDGVRERAYSEENSKLLDDILDTWRWLKD